MPRELPFLLHIHLEWISCTGRAPAWWDATSFSPANPFSFGRRNRTWYLSPIYRWRKISHVEKISDFNTWQMWRNFKFLHMQRNFSFFHTIDAEKCEFLPNLEEFHISPHDRCEEMKKLPCFVVLKSVLWRITLFLRNPFWRDLRAFAWRKIEPKIG